MLQELRTEREQIEEAILTLERLAAGRGKRRGRPPAWLKAAQEGVPAEALVVKPAKRPTSIRAGRKKKEESKLLVEQAS